MLIRLWGVNTSRENITDLQNHENDRVPSEYEWQTEARHARIKEIFSEGEGGGGSDGFLF